MVDDASSCVKNLFADGKFEKESEDILKLKVTYLKEEIQAEPDHKLITLKKYCLETIDSFQSNGICHGDIRAPNFIFKENKAFIIDFGFSKFTTDPEDFKNDFTILDGN